MKITDKDIAIVEILHDALLEEGIMLLTSDELVKSRSLIRRMYAAVYPKTYTEADMVDNYNKGIADAQRLQTNIECVRPITFKISEAVNTYSKEVENRINEIIIK